MIDLLLVVLAAGLGGSCLAVAYSPWLLIAVLAFAVCLLAALVARRTGLLVAAAAIGAAAFLAAALAGRSPRLWQAFGFGVGLLVLLDVSWDRLRMVQARLEPRTYARRLAYLGKCALVSGATVFVAATLGYGAALRFRVSLPVVAALTLAAVTAAALALLILGALRQWRREREEQS